MDVFYGSYFGLYNSLDRTYKYKLGKDFEFTGRIMYYNNGDMQLEIQNIVPCTLPNPAYNKYWGDRRKYIKSKKQQWKYWDSFYWREETPTPVIVECTK